MHKRAQDWCAMIDMFPCTSIDISFWLLKECDGKSSLGIATQAAARPRRSTAIERNSTCDPRQALKQDQIWRRLVCPRGTCDCNRPGMGMREQEHKLSAGAAAALSDHQCLWQYGDLKL